MDDLRGGDHRLLPLFPHCHGDKAVLPGEAVEYLIVPAHRAGRRTDQVLVCQLPAGQHRHGLHVLLLCVVHVESVAGKDVRHRHD